MSRRIIVKIDPVKGTIEYAIEGIEGASCTDISSILSKGQQVEEEGYTAQYYVPELVPNELQNKPE